MYRDISEPVLFIVFRQMALRWCIFDCVWMYPNRGVKLTQFVDARIVDPQIVDPQLT